MLLRPARRAVPMQRSRLALATMVEGVRLATLTTLEAGAA
jgi:hypothetical protein